MAVASRKDQGHAPVHPDLACEIFDERRFPRASPGQIADTNDRIREPLARQNFFLIKPAERPDPEAVPPCREGKKRQEDSARRIVLLVLRQESKIILHAVHFYQSFLGDACL